MVDKKMDSKEMIKLALMTDVTDLRTRINNLQD